MLVARCWVMGWDTRWMGDDGNGGGGGVGGRDGCANVDGVEEDGGNMECGGLQPAADSGANGVVAWSWLCRGGGWLGVITL